MGTTKKPNTPSTGADRLFDSPRRLVDFAFDQSVAAVFPDMIRRSVPGYETVTPLTGLIAARHLTPNGRCYDLGCSLGAATAAVLRAAGDQPCEIVAVDGSADMLNRAQDIAGSEPRIRWMHADVRNVAIEDADAVILNYTLQFLPPADRLPLLQRIRAGLRDTGVLLLSEKLVASAYLEDLHLDFKRANGYSELAISQKRAALENVMRIDAPEDHLARLGRAGFEDAEMWFRCLNWGAFAAFPKQRPGVEGPGAPR